MIYPLTLAFLGVLIYSNTFHASFQYDDMPAIVDNPAVRNLFDLPAVWNAFNTRFFTGLTLAFNYHFGRLDVTGYHIFNITVHILASWLVYRFCLLTFETPVLSAGASAKQKNRIAFLAALLFLTHPIQTQAVTYIWQRAASLATVFYLLSLVFYVKYRFGSSKFIYGMSLVCASIGMFSKETTFTLPFAVLLYEICFFKSSEGNRWKRFYPVVPFLLMLPIIPLTLTRSPDLTLWLMRPHSEILKYDSALDTISRFTGESIMQRSTYMLTQINVLRTYLRLLIVPVNQNLDYDYPLTHSLFEPATFFSLMLLFGILGLGIHLFKDHRLASFGIFWFFLTLSVESLVPQNDVIYEHRLYLPMLGVAFFASYWFFYFLDKRSRKMWLAAVFLLIGMFSFLTYQRNFFWKDEVTLWSDVIKKSPKKSRPYHSRAVAYFAKSLSGLSDAASQAIIDMNKAIQILPGLPDAYNHRGAALLEKGLYDKAIEDFNKAIELKPDYEDAYNNRGVAYLDKGYFDPAIEDFDRAIAIRPTYADAYNNRGVAYLNKEKGLFDPAISDFDKAIQNKPDYADAYNNRGNAYQAKSEFDRAISDYNRVIDIKPNFAEAYNNRGGAYFAKGLFDHALSDFSQAIAIRPDYVDAYRNRAAVYRQGGQPDKSREDIAKAEALVQSWIQSS